MPTGLRMPTQLYWRKEKTLNSARTFCSDFPVSMLKTFKLGRIPSITPVLNSRTLAHRNVPLAANTGKGCSPVSS